MALPKFYLYLIYNQFCGQMQFYLQSITQALQALHTSPGTGLSHEEVQKRLSQYGYNRLQQGNRRHPLWILIEQFNSPLVFILVGASVLSVYLEAHRDAIILLSIVVANALFGFYQEWQAENVLASLKELVTDRCQVIRGGRKVEIFSTDLVPGDIVCIEEGDGIPADMRLLESQSLATNDFILTGESAPVDRDATSQYHEALPLAQQHNCVYMGTTVARGSAKGVVFATGMHTEIGRLAHRTQSITESLSPLQREIAAIAQKIIYITIVIALGLFGIRFLTNGQLHDALIFAVGVAAAMVPEGLPAQISVALALGMGRLARNNAVVKKLASIETLGSATVIASDKTGTITKNEMTITQVEVNGVNFVVSGIGYTPTGDILDTQGNRLSTKALANYREGLLSGFLASTARINPPDAYHKTWYAVGDPTEAAFAVLVLKLGDDLEAIEAQYPKLQIFSFDSFRKIISIVRYHTSSSTYKVFAKGALESLLPRCTHRLLEGAVRPLTAPEKSQILEYTQVFAAQGLRIIGLAYKDTSPAAQYRQEEVEQQLIFTGFATMYDPPHAEVKNAIASAFEAHLKVAMITGDNEITAKAIANQIGMMNENARFPEAINGQRLQAMSDAEVYACFRDRAVVFSRVSPDDKLRIVDILKQHGEVVAVTGDGVNDTLSLKRADIGVAMGMRGSKVAQEAANMVLLNDDFSTIVLAIREGRTIYRNLEKTILASISANIAELSCVLIGFLGAFGNIPIPILAMQILLIDLVGEMFPLLMLTYDPAEQDLMQQPPRQQGQFMLNRRSLTSIMLSGIIIGALSYGAFLIAYLYNPHPTRHYESCLTVTYVSIIIGQFMNILYRRTERSVFTPYLFANIHLLFGFVLSFVLVLMIVYVPLIQEYVQTAPLNLVDWGLAILMGIVFLAIHESPMLHKMKQR